MTLITSTNAQKDGMHWHANADELGLGLGEFPRTLATDLGNGLEFSRVKVTEYWAKYHQTVSCVTLTIWS